MTAREWTQAAPGVRVCHSSLYGTASTVVTSSGHALLVDPAWTPDELAGIATDLHAAGLAVTAGFSTHAHHDHLLWHPGFGIARRWASRRTAVLATQHRGDLLTALGPGFADDGLTEVFARVEALPGAGSGIPGWAGDVEFVVHDGHCPGHTAVWLPAARVLLAGDMLSDVEIPLIQDGSVAEYDAALVALRPFVERAEVVVPGHGAPTNDPMTRWLADRTYLDALLAGSAPDDDRLSAHDMAEAHRDNVARAAESG